jgi:MFS transporter, DHA2 family, multidrug resistance protein
MPSRLVRRRTLRTWHITASTQAELTKSFSSAADAASRYPTSVQDNIIAGAKTSCLQGDQWAYTAGIVAVLLGAALVFFCFPKVERERQLLAEYNAENVGEVAAPAAARA